MREDKNVYEAKQSIKSHIKFLESLLSHLNSSNEVFKARAMWASWCLNDYMNNRLAKDMEHAMSEKKESK